MGDAAAPHELCRELLTRLDRAGVLKGRVLVGGWCGYFYKYFFSYLALPLEPREVDFAAVAASPTRQASSGLLEAMKPAGFSADILCDGYVRLAHRDLIVEFLVPTPVKRRRLDAELADSMDFLLSKMKNTKNTVLVWVDGMYAGRRWRRLTRSSAEARGSRRSPSSASCRRAGRRP